MKLPRLNRKKKSKSKNLASKYAKKGLKFGLKAIFLNPFVLAGFAIILSFAAALMLLTSSSDANCAPKDDLDPEVVQTVDGPNGNLNTSLDNKVGANKPNIKKFIDFANENLGLSGTQIASLIAIGARESGWNPQAGNASGGVGGIFQWSGAHGNTINGNRLGSHTDKTGIDPNDVNTWTLENEFKLVEAELSSSKTKVVQQFIDNIQSSEKGDFEANLKIWSVGYEGVAWSDGQTKAKDVKQYAQDAMMEFPELATINGDINKLNDLIGKNITSGTPQPTPVGDQKEDCDDEEGSDEETENPKEYNSKTMRSWKRNEVPENLQKDIRDPEKAGVMWHGEGWRLNWSTDGIYGNCTDFADTYMEHLYPKMKRSSVYGHGYQVTQKMYELNKDDSFFGSSSEIRTKPKAGDIGSSGVGIPGHVFIVVHVYKSGDMLIAEQNTPYSGFMTGNGKEWNYSYVGKDIYTADQGTYANSNFWRPAGQKPQWNGK